MDGLMRNDAVAARLAAAGLELPAAPQARGSYAPYSATALAGAILVCISGQASRRDGVPLIGRCEPGADLAPARDACAQAALSGLAALAQACGGDLGRVRAITQLRGYLRSDPEFDAHSAVLDGASAVLEVVFPAMPRPARSAIGVSSLPGRCWAEIEITALVSA
ncbi:hypothetical protein CEG14_13810 [Bordetella genomosp. 1]|uniref:Endoribonuclease L-PSP/chorismate mutase-like domain-containing protein n=1 Tax=Bordetella genomosp. 1 TaxID=1395607 RepID=A0A261SFD8_9BORD|nr:RidA family protein [Bordetella genomosp. 1]OZI36104.1 hypothetical protein CEG14_13810 [Bordetella genomosp. 1]